MSIVKYVVSFIITWSCIESKALDDTLFVDDIKDIRYLNYKDSLEAYQIGYSVAKNISDTLKSMYGYKDLESYFLNRYEPGVYTTDGGYFYEYVENPSVDVGHLNVPYKKMKNDASFPWTFLEAQYKRLNVIKIQPSGLMEGAELPDVFVYTKPQTPVIFKVVKRFTVVGQIIKFRISDGGKTKTPYIEKIYYVEDARKHQIIDSIEKLDPVFHKHLDF